ncbi:hypothetical protein MXB_3909 [Myxobolus squamalis]|nr:hypothetical protein MXB_3909 [Myxobolus squamalis]
MESGIFHVDKDFCSICGTFLTLNIKKTLLICNNCGFRIDALDRKISNPVDCIVFNEIVPNSKKSEAKSKNENVGARVDRTCQKCGNTVMIFKTFQSRNADEGQTVFYTCEKCDYAEFEYA